MHAAIGLGANLGDREAAIRDAVARLAALPGVHGCRLSSLYETAPVGGPPQGWYLNAVAVLDTDLGARALLEACLTIEQEAGRVRGVRNAPRVLDLDLLMAGDHVVEEPGLTLPHPELHRRRFVLLPLAEVAPGMRHPVLGRSVRELLGELGLEAPGDVVRPYRP